MSERLSPEQQRKLDAMILLHREFTAAAQARLTALVRGQALIAGGVLAVGDVCRALGISEGTWFRWARQLGLRELAAAVLAEIDGALRSAGANERTTVAEVRGNPDMELALLMVGGRFRTTETEE